MTAEELRSSFIAFAEQPTVDLVQKFSDITKAIVGIPIVAIALDGEITVHA